MKFFFFRIGFRVNSRRKLALARCCHQSLFAMLIELRDE
jgi:hypothetical protein